MVLTSERTKPITMSLLNGLKRTLHSMGFGIIRMVMEEL